MKRKTKDRAGDTALDALDGYGFDSKPNTAKFLKAYVESVRISTTGKISLWPKIRYDIGKCVVRFKDGTSLIKDFQAPAGFPRFYAFAKLDEIELSGPDEDRIDRFFRALELFKYVRNGVDDVRVFSTDVAKTNEKLEQETACA